MFITNINSNRIKFYEILNGDCAIQDFEYWLYSTPTLEQYLGSDYYLDLISFDFNKHDTLPYLKSIVQQCFDWYEYEKWRTIKLLTAIQSGEIDIVLATRKMRQIYLEQEDELDHPLLSITLAIGYESELDSCPIPSEYHLWEPTALRKQCEPIQWYKDAIIKDVKQELALLLTSSL